MRKKEFDETRFDLLDHWLNWYGGFNSKDIGDVLGLSRQNVSILIREFKKSRPSGTIEYDASKKMHVPGKNFRAKRSMSKSHLFLDHLRGQELMTMYRAMNWWDPENEILFENLDRYGCPEPDEDVVRTILIGIHQRKIIDINYQSRRKDSKRLISPNRLVYAVDRYHVRAFCHKTGTYRDFVLTRIFDAKVFHSIESEGGVSINWVSEENDKAWQTRCVLRFRPNHKLPEDIIRTLKRDYPVVGGVLTIDCNEATAPYLEMKFARPDFKLRIPQWVKLG